MSCQDENVNQTILFIKSAAIRLSDVLTLNVNFFRVTGGELFEDIVAREYYSEADARLVLVIKCKSLINTLIRMQELNKQLN